MKFRTPIALLALTVAWSCAADVTNTFMFNSGFANGGVVPDSNLAGWSDTRTISGTGQIVDVNVWLELSGGFNGDLYGYLTHSSGFAVLINRPGADDDSPFGYPDAGLDIKFDDDAANGDFHFYQLVGGYNTSLLDGSSWMPDGRNVDPATVNGSETQDSLLDQFVGLSGDGTWTLFLADLSLGEEATVVRWGIEITSIPEPSAVTLWGLGLLGLGAVMRRRRAR